MGAVTRYIVKGISLGGHNTTIPWNTLIINVTGSLIMVMILTTAFEVWDFDSDLRLGITTGFLGAYTTFSTLCRETAVLLLEGHYLSAFSYVALSAILGLLAAYSGFIIAQSVISRIVKGEATDNGESISALMDGEVE